MFKGQVFNPSEAFNIAPEVNDESVFLLRVNTGGSSDNLIIQGD